MSIQSGGYVLIRMIVAFFSTSFTAPPSAWVWLFVYRSYMALVSNGSNDHRYYNLLNNVICYCYQGGFYV
ncbi:hypothetical protein GYMLUDRAFT_370831 [Collybiopsis luxurians FD-317 M1]|uniref:Uncharacterized protein n=1 Tax=Collybiopsis luxurians FD-317 M1 TaxID=944289 RepID=A0A0D0CB94_9AGAR|nr:hypothetical protein GYMLUDRAFT_370831 [Collybiopsis luxurians FD-317 M1]